MVDASTTVGSITGELRLDISDWVRKIDEADAKAKELEGKSATLAITADTAKLDEAVDRVEAEVEALDGETVRIGVEIDSARADAKLEEVRAEAAKPIVQRVQIVTEGGLTTSYGDDGTTGGYQGATLRPTGMGSSTSEAAMATERLGANGDLVQSYQDVERATRAAGTAFTSEEMRALNATVAKLQLSDANKAAADAEKAYVKILGDEKASVAAVDEAEKAAVVARRAATEAEAELSRTTAEAGAVAEDAGGKIADGGKKAAASGQAAQGATGMYAALGLAILGIGPALIPLAVAAVADTAALGGLGLTGILAFKGIEAAIKSGSEEGQAYSSMLATLKSDAAQLEGTAASGILGGVSTAAGELQQAMPSLNREVGVFADELGQIIPTGLDAVFTMVERGAPLLQQAGQGLVGFVDGIDGFSHSNGFEEFLTSAEQDLPQVGAMLDDTGKFLVAFLSSMAPYGSAVLGIVDDAMKLGTVLAPVAPAVWAIVTAMTALKLGGPAIAAVSGFFATLGATAAVTAEEVASVAVAEDVASEGATLIPQAAAAAGGTALMGKIIGLGVVGATAEGLSLSAQGTIPGHGGSPVDTSYGATVSHGASGASAVDTSYGGFGAAPTRSTPSRNSADTSYNGFGAGQTPPPPPPAAPVTTLANAYKALAAAEQATYTAQQKLATQNQSLVQTGDAADTAMTGLRKALDLHNLSLKGSSAAAVQNREAILSAVQAAQKHADAINADGKHTAEAAVYTDRYALSLEKNLVQLGMSKSAADAYIKKLLGMPKSASLTVALHDAEAQAYLDAIRSKMNNLNGTAATVYVNAVASGISTGRAAQIAKNAGMADGGTAGIPGAANGVTAGTITGPGNAAADLAGLYRLANGEEVTSNKHGQADAFRPVLKAIGGQQVRTIDDLAAMLGASRRGPVTTKTVNVGGVHLHNPVAVDPVESAENASQAIATYASFPL